MKGELRGAVAVDVVRYYHVSVGARRIANGRSPGGGFGRVKHGPIAAATHYIRHRRRRRILAVGGRQPRRDGHRVARARLGSVQLEKFFQVRASLSGGREDRRSGRVRLLPVALGRRLLFAFLHDRLQRTLAHLLHRAGFNLV